ncbi:hypothetical protein AB691_1961 [Stutzerimonas stutzeri]|nr:hypothetical protein AB691_1961 [Stutzerimonas stutzeri]
MLKEIRLGRDYNARLSLLKRAIDLLAGHHDGVEFNSAGRGVSFTKERDAARIGKTIMETRAGQYRG